jgi:hypothetical protein
MHPQQPLAPRPHHQSDEVRGILPSSSRRNSGRHASMSSPILQPPPNS